MRRQMRDGPRKVKWPHGVQVLPLVICCGLLIQIMTKSNPFCPAEAVPAITLLTWSATMIVCGIAAGVMRYDGTLTPAFVVSGGIWLIAVALRWLSAVRIAASMQIALVILMTGALAALASALAATTAFPLVDATLVAADGILLPGFDWRATMMSMQRHPTALWILSHAYASLAWQPFLLAALYCASCREAAAWRFATTWAVALLLTLLIFPWMPAVGAYAHFGMTRNDVPAVLVSAAWDFLPLLRGLRDGSIDALGTGIISGIVTMPSFHAAASVIIGWFSLNLGTGRLLFLPLNALMLASSVPVGGHYLVDVLAGIGTAALAIAAGRGLHGTPRIDARASTDLSLA